MATKVGTEQVENLIPLIDGRIADKAAASDNVIPADDTKSLGSDTKRWSFLSTKLIKIFNAAGTFYTGLKAGALAATTVFTLPPADGTTGDFLKTDGAGNLTFAPVPPPPDLSVYVKSDGTVPILADGFLIGGQNNTTYTQFQHIETVGSEKSSIMNTVEDSFGNVINKFAMYNQKTFFVGDPLIFQTILEALNDFGPMRISFSAKDILLATKDAKIVLSKLNDSTYELTNYGNLIGNGTSLFIQTPGGLILDAQYISANGKQINNVADPTGGKDAANKDYVLSQIPAAGANQYLSNLLEPVLVNQTIRPQTDNSFELGTFNKRWSQIVASSGIFVAQDGTGSIGTFTTDGSKSFLMRSAYGEYLDVPSGRFVNGKLIFSMPGVANSNLGIMTGTQNSGVQSGGVYVESGNVLGSAPSGDVSLQTGTTSGTRGKVILDGSVIDVSSKRIINVADPVNGTDAANKNFVLANGGPSTTTLKSYASQMAGANWTSRVSSANQSWFSIAYGVDAATGIGTYVAVSGDGTATDIMTSNDGYTWTSHSSGVLNAWYGVTYGNGLFVAVGSYGTTSVITSPDGITWTPRTPGNTNSYYSVTYEAGLFVAVSVDGVGNRVMTSPDGITWTSRTSASNNNWQSVTYGNGLFVAVAGTGTGNRVMTSPDGITWTSRTSASDMNWSGVTYGNGKYVAVAPNGGTASKSMYSSDGINWFSGVVPIINNWSAIAYGGGCFVATATVSQYGTNNRSMTSVDGINWNVSYTPVNNIWRAITFGNEMWVAVASTGSNDRVMTTLKTGSY